MWAWNIVGASGRLVPPPWPGCQTCETIGSAHRLPLPGDSCIHSPIVLGSGSAVREEDKTASSEGVHRTCDSSEEVPAAAWEAKEGFLEKVIFTLGPKG